MMDTTGAPLPPFKKPTLRRMSPPPATSLSLRDWSSLPDLVLLSILHRLSPSLPDLHSFAAVCRSFRHFLRSSSPALLPNLPPLLLHPNPHPLPSDPTFLPQPLSTGPHPPLRSLLPPQTLALTLLGSSHGHLILLRRGPCHREPILADALSGSQILLPNLPSGRYPYYYAALTAAPKSPNCHLLFFYSPYEILSCRLTDLEWKRSKLGGGISHVVRILPFKDRAFAVNDKADLLEMEFTAQDLSFKKLGVGGIGKKLDFDRWHLGPQLVECGGELLLVLFVQPEHRMGIKIEAYRLDMGRMVWGKVEDLGEWSLFVDCGGRNPVSCFRPERWGGESNRVYVAGPGYGTWKMFALDGNWVYNTRSSPLSSWRFLEPRWPSPIWVYPSLFF